MEKKLKFNLPKNVSFIISRLKERGFRADIVGGSVRNLLLGIPVSDYDITTSALPEEVKGAFPDMRTVDTGIKHGTVTLVIDGEPYEITTYRFDGEYDDNRHPRGVTFSSSLEEDLARRDFTVNAMCYSEEYGITDIFGGIADVEQAIIRAVGVAEDRFDEDGLRILRALRFASVLGFRIEEKTDKAIRKKKDLIKNISRERIYSELKKLIAGKGAYAILSSYREVISLALNEAYLYGLVSEEAFEKLKGFDRIVSLFVNLGIEAPLKFNEALKRLKSDNASLRLGKQILELYFSADFSSDGAICRMLREYGAESLLGAARLRRAFSLSKTDETERTLSVLSRKLPYKVSHLDIDGHDLSSLGFSGKAIGEVLLLLLDFVIDGKIENKREILREKAKEFI